MDELKGDRKNIMPSRTSIESYSNYIANGKRFGDYTGGRFEWTCASCLNIKESSKALNLSDRLNRLESVLLLNNTTNEGRFQSLQNVIITLQNQVADMLSQKQVDKENDASANTFTADITSSVPTVQSNDHGNILPLIQPAAVLPVGDYRAAVTSEQVVLPEIQQHSSATTPRPKQAVSGSRNTGVTKPIAKFSMRVSKKDEGLSMTKTLEALAIDKKIDCYNFRSRGKFAVDLLLDDSVVASKAHDTLTEAVDDSVVVALPEMICPKRVFFVGLPGKISADKLLDLLSNRFPELLLKKSNKYCIKIFEPKCCKNDKNQIRSTVYLSEELYNFFMINLSGRVPVGFYTILNVYDCVERCIKCQGFGHTVESCRKKVSVCGYCGGNHYTGKCPHKNDVDKHHCVNCYSSEKFRDQCKGHGAIDPKCPFYLDYISNKDKG